MTRDSMPRRNLGELGLGAFFLGKIHEKRGETERAREYYRRFVEFWSDGDLDRARVDEARSKI